MDQKPFICCDRSDDYKFEKFTTHIQHLFSFIGQYSVFASQAPRQSTGSTGTSWKNPFTVQGRDQIWS